MPVFCSLRGTSAVCLGLILHWYILFWALMQWDANLCISCIKYYLAKCNDRECTESILTWYCDITTLLVLKLHCNKSNAYRDWLTSPLLKRRPHFWTQEGTEIFIMELKGTEARNDCAGKGQQKSKQLTNWC
jgi:hypothetical protein